MITYNHSTYEFTQRVRHKLEIVLSDVYIMNTLKTYGFNHEKIIDANNLIYTIEHYGGKTDNDPKGRNQEIKNRAEVLLVKWHSDFTRLCREAFHNDPEILAKLLSS